MNVLYFSLNYFCFFLGVKNYDCFMLIFVHLVFLVKYSFFLCIGQPTIPISRLYKATEPRVLLVKLKSSLRKFYGRHDDLIDRYEISVSQMTTDMFHL